MYKEVSIVIIGIIAIIIAVLVLRKEKERKVILMGERGTGKTKLFSYLCRKYVKGVRTLPSMEEVTQRVSGSVLLVDTPGVQRDQIKRKAEGLTQRDTVLYLYKNESHKVSFNGVRCKVVEIYAGEGETDCKYRIDPSDEYTLQETSKQLAKQLRITLRVKDE
ncbi:hypothetical protein NEFER03_0051 [Nematocida sp. LUAm3]|nr:hypothetical protein NEFER03_0051 [Nematocida sp. LUAm3]KAI5176267.1 hypothetical protein NEFER02_2064 [Nematocida sp. LUAm2]KAI5176725.1 hypothetical protein NEFER01_0050 [Nematocida sp. LUAm1]